MKQWLQHITSLCRRDRSTAASGERHVARYLRRQGYRVLARNLRNRCGEIDIVTEAPDGRTIAIVEVKSSARARRRPASRGPRPRRQAKKAGGPGQSAGATSPPR